MAHIEDCLNALEASNSMAESLRTYATMLKAKYVPDDIVNGTTWGGAAMWQQLCSISIVVICANACTRVDGPSPTAYRTDGSAEIQVCKGAGIEKCEYEPTEVPELIDLRDSNWDLLRSERKSSTLTMCYLDLPGATFTKRKLMFDCEPIYDPLPDTDSMNSSKRQAALIKSMANMAEAAATFEVCRDYYGDDTDKWLAWNGHVIALRAIAEQMTPAKDDAALYLAFEARRAQLVESEGFRSETLEYMSNCDANSFDEAGEYIRQNEDIARYYLPD